MKKIKLEKGITLIALIITIIILLILAVVTIGSIKNSNIITYAQNASKDYNAEKDKEESTIAGYESLIESSLSEGKEKIVTNPYKGIKDWSLVYTCTNGVWENTPLTEGETIPEDADIIAYFYKTGEMITPTFPEGSLPEGEEYHMVVEGTGEMPKMLEGESGFAWQHDQWTGGANIQYNYYVTELTICTGITSIGEGAFYNGMSLKKVAIPSSVTNIKEDAFFACWNLTDITLPNTITRIGESAFYQCGLINITIPSSVSFIGVAAFGESPSLEKIKILTTSFEIEKITNDTNAFEYLAEGACIYVLNTDVLQKLEGTYDASKTTVRVVTAAEMNEI